MEEIDERYQNAVIYTIKTNDGLYVGSTVNFYTRKCKHKSNVKLNCKTLLYQNIRANNDEYIIEIHKLFPCSNSLELRLEERNVCEELNANLNTCKPYQTEEERLEQIIIKNKKFNLINNKKRAVCECGIEMLKRSLYKHRQSDAHKLAMLRKIDGNMLDFLCKPTENVVITKTNNSHTTPYPSDDEDE